MYGNSTLERKVEMSLKYTIDGVPSDDPGGDEYTATELLEIHHSLHETKGEEGWYVCAWDGESYPCAALYRLAVDSARAILE